MKESTDIKAAVAHCMARLIEDDMREAIEIMEMFAETGQFDNHIEFDFGNACVSIQLKREVEG